MGVTGLSNVLKDSEFSIIKEQTLDSYKNKKIAFDGFNVLYQFLSTIRDSKGLSLTDREGRVTSHLIGLLSRNSQLLSKGIKIIYVFDGEAHKLKAETVESRSEVKFKAENEYKEALKAGNLGRAKMLGQRMSRLDKEMIEDSKKLLKCMGIPVVEALGEGEAQAAQLVTENSAFAVGSQDYDSLLFGAPVLLRNVNLSGKRGLPGGRVKTIYPQEIELKKVIAGLKLTREQLVDIGILMGTDFNPNGFRGVGGKTAVRYITKYQNFRNTQKAEQKVGECEEYDIIREIFLNPAVKKNVKIKFGEYDKEAILNFLVAERGFSEDRYTNLLQTTAESLETLAKQTGINDFFS